MRSRGLNFLMLFLSLFAQGCTVTLIDAEDNFHIHDNRADVGACEQK
jgi:hypothetical protein